MREVLPARSDAAVFLASIWFVYYHFVYMISPSGPELPRKRSSPPNTINLLGPYRPLRRGAPGSLLEQLLCIGIVAGLFAVVCLRLVWNLFEPLLLALQKADWSRVIIRPRGGLMGSLFLAFRTVLWFRYRPFPPAVGREALSLTVMSPHTTRVPWSKRPSILYWRLSTLVTEGVPVSVLPRTDMNRLTVVPWVQEPETDNFPGRILLFHPGQSDSHVESLLAILWEYLRPSLCLFVWIKADRKHF